MQRSLRPRAFAGLCLLMTVMLPAVSASHLLGLPDIGVQLPKATDPRCRLGLPATIAFDTQLLQRLWDYGDAPDSTKFPMTTFYTFPGAPFGSFPTLATTVFSAFGTPGARHDVVNVGWLGNHAAYAAPVAPLNVFADLPPTEELDADAFPDQDLVITNLAGTPDHDGRDDSLVPAFLATWSVGTLTYRLSSIPGFQNWYVNILIDWNYDGMWAGFDPLTGAPEWVTVNQVVSVPAMTSILVTTPPFLTGSSPYEPWVRITLSDTPIPVAWPGGWDGSVPPGTFDGNGQPAFACGETEDYCGQVKVYPDPTRPSEKQVFCQREQDPHPDPHPDPRQG